MRASTQHLQSGQPLPCARRRQVAAYASKTARKPGKEKAASSDKGANQQAKQRARVLQEERTRSTKAADEVQKVLRDAGAVIKNVEAATLSGAYLCWYLFFHCPGAVCCAVQPSVKLSLKGFKPNVLAVGQANRREAIARLQAALAQQSPLLRASHE